MITVKKIRESSENNPFGEDLVELMKNRLDQLDGQVQAVNDLVKDFKCNNSDHSEFENEVILAEDGKSFQVNACCPTFTETIKQALST